MTLARRKSLTSRFTDVTENLEFHIGIFRFKVFYSTVPFQPGKLRFECFSYMTLIGLCNKRIKY